MIFGEVLLWSLTMFFIGLEIMMYDKDSGEMWNIGAFFALLSFYLLIGMWTS